MKKITSLLTVVLLSASALPLSAQIIFDSNVVIDNAATAGGFTTISNYAPTSGSNAILLVGYTQDGGNNAIQQATFGGNNMTLLSNNDRTQIYGYVLSDTTAGDIVIDASQPSVSQLVYGTLRNVDTSNFGSLPTVTGATFNSGTVTTTSSSSFNLSGGEYVFSVYNTNGLWNYTGSTPSAGMSTISFESPAEFNTGYTAGIYGGTIASSGSYTPSVAWTGTGNSTSPSATLGSAVAFTAVTAIPEPSTFAALAGLGALGLAASRRRRHA